ncbi:hypothetical protein ACRCI8_00535 [Staphylococcus aureus]
MNRIYDSGIKFPDRIMALITGDVKEINEQFKERVKKKGYISFFKLNLPLYVSLP